MVSMGTANPSNGQSVRVIPREAKGLTMVFHSDHVVKQYDNRPTHISLEDQDRRFTNEIAAYQRFEELNCPFVPRLIAFSLQDRWLSISRIQGNDLLALSQSGKRPLPIRSILDQIDQMNIWLRSFAFSDMENNIKDMVLDESGKLYLVDFEPYSQDTNPTVKPDIYNALIDDILQRIFIRRGRKAKLTPQFIRLSIGILSRRPLKTTQLALHYLVRGLSHLTMRVFRH